MTAKSLADVKAGEYVAVLDAQGNIVRQRSRVVSRTADGDIMLAGNSVYDPRTGAALGRSTRRIALIEEARK